MQKFTGLFEDAKKIDYAMKMGYSWFDMMYPRGSDAEARELKIGKYADPVLNEMIGSNYKESLSDNSSHMHDDTRLSGKKRARKN